MVQRNGYLTPRQLFIIGPLSVIAGSLVCPVWFEDRHGENLSGLWPGWTQLKRTENVSPRSNKENLKIHNHQYTLLMRRVQNINLQTSLTSESYTEKEQADLRRDAAKDASTSGRRLRYISLSEQNVQLTSFKWMLNILSMFWTEHDLSWDINMAAGAELRARQGNNDPDLPLIVYLDSAKWKRNTSALLLLESMGNILRPLVCWGQKWRLKERYFWRFRTKGLRHRRLHFFTVISLVRTKRFPSILLRLAICWGTWWLVV